MSEERQVIDPKGGEVSLSEALKTDLEEHKKLRAEKKAKLARILDRGVVADRLSVDLPSELYGEWVVNEKSEIHRMQTLGFKIDTQYAKAHALHDQGDDRAIVGDTVFMVCDRETKDILDEIRRENYERVNGKPGEERKGQAEEREFSEPTKGLHIGPVVEESRERVVRKEQLEAALQKGAAPASPVKAGTRIKRG